MSRQCLVSLIVVLVGGMCRMCIHAYVFGILGKVCIFAPELVRMASCVVRSIHGEERLPRYYVDKPM